MEDASSFFDSESEFGFPIDSEYMERQHLFEENPEQAVREVTVWTESIDDIRLWMQVFKDNEKYTFHFLPASKFNADGASGNGCNRLIKLCDNGSIGPGKQNIICLDSDYKFIARQNAEYSGRDYTTPHFFWTYIHSKEHIFLASNLLDNLVAHSSCVPITQLQQKTIDIYTAISLKIYEPITSLIYLMSLRFDDPDQIIEDFKIRFRDALFTLLQLKQGILNFKTCETWSVFTKTIDSLTEDFKSFFEKNNITSKLDSFRSNLETIGACEENIYLFTRGHDWDSVAQHITKCHLDFLQETQLEEIRRSSHNVKGDINSLLNRTPKLNQAILSTIPSIDNFPFFEKTVTAAREIYNV